jgi:stress response protein YsnF
MQEQEREKANRSDESSLIPLESIDNQTIRLLAERLVVDYHRRKVGEVVVRKEVEIETIEVPVRRERLIVEQISPEHKQLASIELNQGDVSDIEIRDAAELESAKQTTQPKNESISAKVASQLLDDIVSHPDYRTVKVRLVFDDALLQAEYLKRLAHYLNTSL